MEVNIIETNQKLNAFISDGCKKDKLNISFVNIISILEPLKGYHDFRVLLEHHLKTYNEHVDINEFHDDFIKVIEAYLMGYINAKIKAQPQYTMYYDILVNVYMLLILKYKMRNDKKTFVETN